MPLGSEHARLPAGGSGAIPLTPAEGSESSRCEAEAGVPAARSADVTVCCDLECRSSSVLELAEVSETVFHVPDVSVKG